MSLYIQDDKKIITHSMIKSMGRCPRQTMYKYHDRLKPKQLSKPLKRGNWMHSLLEAKYKGKKWKKVHKVLSRKFGQLFEEERETLGDLPRECEKLMTSYLWHYRDDQDWKVLEVEYTIETELPNGMIYRGRVDMLVETPFGLYVVDHKTHKSLPNTFFRMQDVQSALYIWACQQLGIDVRGFIWNYVKTIGPKPIRFNLNRAISKGGPPYKGETDYLTAKQSLIDHGDDPKDFDHILLPLKKQRYVSGTMQLSPFFRRNVLEKDDDLLKQVLAGVLRTADRADTYDFNDRLGVERVIDRSCEWMCSYSDLCMTELFGGNSQQVLRQQFRVGDPMDYYYDQKERTE